MHDFKSIKSLGCRDTGGRSTATLTATAGRPRDRPLRWGQQRRRLRPLRLVGCNAAILYTIQVIQVDGFEFELYEEFSSKRGFVCSFVRLLQCIVINDMIYHMI